MTTSRIASAVHDSNIALLYVMYKLPEEWLITIAVSQSLEMADPELHAAQPMTAIQFLEHSNNVVPKLKIVGFHI